MRIFMVTLLPLLLCPLNSAAELDLKKLGAMGDPEKETPQPKVPTLCLSELDVMISVGPDKMIPMKEFIKLHGPPQNQPQSPCGTDKTTEKEKRELLSDSPITEKKNSLKKSRKAIVSKSGKKLSESSEPSDSTKKQIKQNSTTKKIK